MCVRHLLGLIVSEDHLSALPEDIVIAHILPYILPAGLTWDGDRSIDRARFRDIESLVILICSVLSLKRTVDDISPFSRDD